MDKKTSFKEFVKKNPSLLRYVKNDSMTWQKFFEIYDMYGEDENIWKEYKGDKKNDEVKTTASIATIGDALTWLKNINLDKMQESISSVQRVLGVLEDFKGTNTNTKPEYKPRPLYKHFED